MMSAPSHHGTAVAVGGRAVLLRGPPGSGKSDLALRLLATPTSALSAFGRQLDPIALIADDRVILTRQAGSIVVSAPANLTGLLEVRRVGLLPLVRCVPGAALMLVADASPPAPAGERMPPVGQSVEIEGLRIPAIALDLQSPSAPLVVLLALAFGVGVVPAQR
jgi:serine kinase of HPr protein (carbohydrate metabolism regulator)